MNSVTSQTAHVRVGQLGSESRRKRLLLSFGLFLGVVSVYLPSLGNDFVYDDRTMILDQSALRTLPDVARVFTTQTPGMPYYRPLTQLSFRLQKSLFGHNPNSYHLINALLMGLAAWLAFALLRLPVFGIRRGPAVWAAAVFALHPIASSCVYPVASGRETLLPAVLVITAVYAFLRGGQGWYVLSQSAFAAALLAKEQAIVVPVLFVLGDALQLSPDSPGRSPARWFWRYTPVVLLTIAYLVIRWSLFHGTEYGLAVFDRPTGPVLSFVYAVQTVFAPFGELVYEPTIDVWPSAARLAIAALMLLALTAAVYKTRDTLCKPSLFWCGWFAVTLLPTANLLRQEVRFSERYVFLAMLAVAAASAAVVSAVSIQPKARKAMLASGLLLLAVCVACTWHRGQYFRNDFAFYRQWTRTNPRCVQAHHNLANSWLQKGRFTEAVKAFETALSIDSSFVPSQYDLAVVQSRCGQLDEAIRHYRIAIKLDPDHARAHLNLGNILYDLGKADAAFAHLDAALRIDPDFAKAHNILGVFLRQQGHHAQARSHLESAIRIDPDFAAAHFNLANVLSDQGNRKQAVNHYRRAKQLTLPNSQAAVDIQRALWQIDQE